MAALTATTVGGGGVKTLTANTLSSSDTFTYTPGQMLILRNGSGGALTFVLTGSAAANTNIEGGGSVAYASGYSTGSVANGAMVSIDLDTIRNYLPGTVTITGGLNATAYLMNP